MKKTFEVIDGRHGDEFIKIKFPFRPKKQDEEDYINELSSAIHAVNNAYGMKDMIQIVIENEN